MKRTEQMKMDNSFQKMNTIYNMDQMKKTNHNQKMPK